MNFLEDALSISVRGQCNIDEKLFKKCKPEKSTIELDLYVTMNYRKKYYCNTTVKQRLTFYIPVTYWMILSAIVLPS